MDKNMKLAVKLGGQVVLAGAQAIAGSMAAFVFWTLLKKGKKGVDGLTFEDLVIREKVK